LRLAPEHGVGQKDTDNSHHDSGDCASGSGPFWLISNSKTKTGFEASQKGRFVSYSHFGHRLDQWLCFLISHTNRKTIHLLSFASFVRMMFLRCMKPPMNKIFQKLGSMRVDNTNTTTEYSINHGAGKYRTRKGRGQKWIAEIASNVIMQYDTVCQNSSDRGNGSRRKSLEIL
jgi:hypothetical protein